MFRTSIALLVAIFVLFTRVFPQSAGQTLVNRQSAVCQPGGMVRCMRKGGYSTAAHMWKVKDEVLTKALDISVDPGSAATEVEVGKADIGCLGSQVDRLNEIRKRIEREVLR